jgi:hypothetical protein
VRTRLFVGVLLFLSSAGTIQKYAGTAAAVVSFPLFLLAAVALLPRLEQMSLRFTNRQALFAAGAGLLLFTVALVVIYPHANTHTPGVGSDRDDSANIGAHRLLHGEYPYGPHTYLGLPVSQLPGALALAAPFVAAFGSSAYANILWLAALVALLVIVGVPFPAGVTVVAAAIVLSPGLLREYLTGGDLIANAIYVAAATVAIFRLAARRYTGPLAAIALGVTLASRLNFAFVLIPIVVALVRLHGARRASALLAVSVLTAGALSAVALIHPAGRESLRVADHLSDLGRVGAAATVAIALAIAVILAARTRRWTESTVLGQAAFVQALFPLALVVHASVAAARLDFAPLISGYGVPPLLLALAASRAPQLDHPAERIEPVYEEALASAVRSDRR